MLEVTQLTQVIFRYCIPDNIGNMYYVKIQIVGTVDNTSQVFLLRLT